jgi:hypothetical protein
MNRLLKSVGAEVRPSQMPKVLPLTKSFGFTPTEHAELMRAITDDFGSRFAPGGKLIFVGETSQQPQYFDEALLRSLGVTLDTQGKMPDVVLYFEERKWLLLVKSVTSHGPVNAKRHAELRKLFAESSVGIVFVTAFPSRAVMGRYLSEIAWETEVWVADSPSHLIHFNGDRFLGPHA